MDFKFMDLQIALAHGLQHPMTPHINGTTQVVVRTRILEEQ